MSPPDLKLLRSFVELAYDGSFTKAAERLHVTQPTLSQQIRRLESQLGFALFMRSTRNVQLTTEGSQLLSRAARLIDNSRDLEDTIRRLQSGGARKLHVGAASYTSDFEQRNAVIDRYILDHSSVPLVIHSASQNELIAATRHLELDLAFVIGMRVSRVQYDTLVSGRQPGEGIYPDDMRAVVLGQRRMELLVPEESPLARMPAIPAGTLRDMPIAMVACAEGRPLLEPIVEVFTQAGARVVFPPEAHVQSSVERYGCITRSLAVSLGWFNDSDLLKQHRMVRRPLAEHVFHTELVLLAPPEDDNPATEWMLQIAEEIAQQAPSRRAA